MRGLKSGQMFNMQTFVYHRIRCIFAGDLAKAFDKFGGASGQWNLLGIVLRLAIAESPFVAMEYDRVIHQRLTALARDRYMGNNPGLNFSALLSNEQTEITRNIVAASATFLRNRPPPPHRDNENRPAVIPGAPGAPSMAGVPGLAIPIVPGDANGVNENARPKFGYGKGKNKRGNNNPLPFAF